MKRQTKYFLLILSLFTVAFLIYCFFPILTHTDSQNTAPWHIFLTDRNGKVITDKATQYGYKKELIFWSGSSGEENEQKLLSSEFVKDLIFIEDKNYFSHWGINIPAKLRALRDNMAGKNMSGWSTITEQYIKNTYFLGYERNYLQKIREALVAFVFSLWYSKHEILTSYLETVYFGNKNFGLAAAMEVYFKKDDVSKLSQEERVLLLSLLRNPGITRLDDAQFQDYFEQVQYRLGYNFTPSYTWKLETKKNIDMFPHVTQRTLGNHSSIDATLQSFSQEIVQETLKGLAEKNVTNAAVFALNPKTWETLIYLGSKDFYATDIDGQVDVIQALRQPGSTMKPFLYLLALESGAHPDDLILDIESEYNSFQEGKVYISENYSLKEYGLVRLKKALGNSFNNASVRLSRELGLQKVYDFYKTYGLNLPESPEYYGYSLVLGNASITLESLVRAYSKLLDLKKPEKYLLYDILSDPDNRDVSFWVNSILNTSIAQAVKTGTSSDFRDNLVISYHPDFVLWVWLGNNDNSSMQGVTGITGAGYIWHQIIEKAITLGYITEQKIPVPQEVVRTSYCLDTACFRKEMIFTQQGSEFASRLTEWVYAEQDIFEKLSSYEQEKLQDLWVHIQKK